VGRSEGGGEGRSLAAWVLVLLLCLWPCFVASFDGLCVCQVEGRRVGLSGWWFGTHDLFPREGGREARGLLA